MCVGIILFSEIYIYIYIYICIYPRSSNLDPQYMAFSKTLNTTPLTSILQAERGRFGERFCSLRESSLAKSIYIYIFIYPNTLNLDLGGILGPWCGHLDPLWPSLGPWCGHLDPLWEQLGIASGDHKASLGTKIPQSCAKIDQDLPKMCKDCLRSPQDGTSPPFKKCRRFAKRPNISKS